MGRWTLDRDNSLFAVSTRLGLTRSLTRQHKQDCNTRGRSGRCRGKKPCFVQLSSGSSLECRRRLLNSAWRCSSAMNSKAWSAASTAIGGAIQTLPNNHFAGEMVANDADGRQQGHHAEPFPQ